eukprot:249950_1
MSGEYRIYKDKYQLLLVGTKSSGKTTILQQQKNNHGDGILHLFHQDLVNTIRNNCISIINKLCEINNDYKTIETLQNLSIENEMDLIQIGDIIQNVWTYNRDTLSLQILSQNENITYYLDQIEYIMDKNYQLSQQDIVKHQTINWEICEFDYMFDAEYQHHVFNLIDYGSNRILKRNLYLFENVTCTLFVASLSDYCLNITQDKNVNAMKESLDYFEEICNNKYLKKNEIFLLLNKFDIFGERIRNGYSLSLCFGDEWNGPNFMNIKVPLIVFGF